MVLCTDRGCRVAVSERDSADLLVDHTVPTYLAECVVLAAHSARGGAALITHIQGCGVSVHVDPLDPDVSFVRRMEDIRGT